MHIFVDYFPDEFHVYLHLEAEIFQLAKKASKKLWKMYIFLMISVFVENYKGLRCDCHKEALSAEYFGGLEKI